jgi:flagellar biosynthetic protein FlhB
MSDGEQPDNSQKTEDPTAKKLDEARKKGQVPLSREVNNFIMLLASTILIGTAASVMFADLYHIMYAYVEQSYAMPTGPGGLSITLGVGFQKVFMVMLLPMLVLMVAAFIGPFGQVGPLLAPELIKPDLSKISPIKGFQRLFSKRSIIEFVKGILKIGLVGLVGVIILKPYMNSIDHMVGLPIPMLMDEIKMLIIKMMIGILFVILVIAAFDLVYQRFEHMQKMRMTKQELKDEYKQTEGDPQVKARLRQLRNERARRRMMQAVPRADVVIVNPTHYSIALEYKPDTMDAPVCIAKGLDDIALKIREVAKAHNIILYENPPLARSLYDVVELDEAIPAEQYKAVAEVISFVFKTKGRGGNA